MNKFRARQSGVSLIGFIIILAVVGFFAFLFMKIFPAYSEYYNVVGAMESVRKEPGSSRWTPAEILGSLEKRMYINYVDDSRVNRRTFQLKRSGNGYTLTVKYERREPLLYNLDYVAKFERTVQLTGKTGDG